MPFQLPVLLSFQGSTHLFGVGSFSYLLPLWEENPQLSIHPIFNRLHYYLINGPKMEKSLQAITLSSPAGFHKKGRGRSPSFYKLSTSLPCGERCSGDCPPVTHTIILSNKSKHKSLQPPAEIIFFCIFHHFPNAFCLQEFR